MRVGLDYRPAVIAPCSGIGRQVLALEKTLRQINDLAVERFAASPAKHPVRLSCNCSPWPSKLNQLHRPLQRLLFEVAFLPRAVRRSRLDLYIATANMGLPFPCLGGTRHVLLIHDLFQLTEVNFHRSALRQQMYRQVDSLSIRYSLKVAHRIWTPSHFCAGEITRHFPDCEGKVRVLPNCVEPYTGRADMPPGQLPGRFWLAVGTREPRKNIPWFVNAWQAARNQRSDTPDLILVGPSDSIPEEQQRATGLHFMQNLNDGQLQWLYQHAECLWQPSRAEGFGLPVIEALAAGTPALVAQGSALDEIAPSWVQRFDSLDSGALVKLMTRLQPAMLHRGDDLKSWAVRYSPQPYLCRVEELLREALS